ncbi:MAG: ATP-binding cassette domain-containing protein [Bacteroidetes bacterium]|uniref:ATP-binding cassette domain-containing protein n=1 Tax=Phaeocystidibacter marisrubri TaxID=1577780 RepID=A0A6L3ZGD2_9FLAO|nr:ATP-binding cassette domain-containing protein [Phaeocystidibacter marisrubri]KAB2815999.1 ATP-binding cassette domain-containing protein [Phaeocystidibacter marisrubri]TNE27788.1 MAG: ATP-binding cassette domain-containing protein [Bacteroidota bacterium]GGH66816.1 ABC transporter ATP-binding protein [Phaeocystidibacter marisrubri]
MSMPKISPLERLYRLLVQDKKEVFYVLFFAVLNGAIGLALPLGFQAIINLVMGGRPSASWWFLVGVVLAAILFAGVLQILQMQITESLQQRIFVRSTIAFSYRIPRLHPKSLVGDNPPELVNRFFDTLTVQKAVPKVLLDASTSALQIFFGLLLLSVYHSLFVVAGAVVVLLVILIFRSTWKRGLRTSLDESTYKYKVAYWLEQMANSMNTFKLAGNSKWPNLKTKSLTELWLGARKSHFKVLVLQYAQLVGFRFILTAMLLIFGGILVFQQQMSIGQFVAVEIVFILITNNADKLIKLAEPLFDTVTALEKLAGVLERPLEGDEGRTLDFNVEAWPLDVTLDETNIRLEAGEKLAVMGYAGSGRTSALRSVAALHPDTMGDIYIDGIQLDNLDLFSYRCGLGDNLSQEAIFEGTLRENLIVGNSTASDHIVIDGLKKVGLYDWFKSLPKGFDERISYESVHISHFTGQRLILLRALLRNPKILLIHDKLEHCEKTLRNQMLDSIFEQKGTTLIASNREDVVMRCSKVVVLKDRKIIYSGPASQLPSEVQSDLLF